MFDVSKIKGKLAKRPPKGVGAAKKEKAAKDKKTTDSKKSKKARSSWLHILTLSVVSFCSRGLLPRLVCQASCFETKLAVA